MGEVLKFPSPEERKLRVKEAAANDNQEMNSMELTGVIKDDFERILRSLPDRPSDMDMIEQENGYVTIRYCLDSTNSSTVVHKYLDFVEREGSITPEYRGFYSDKTVARKSKKQRRRN
jgi:hypothetical protein